MAILGYNTKGASNRAFSLAGRFVVSKFTLASAGTLTELHGWVLGASGQAVRIALYDDDGAAAAAGTRLAYTSSISVPSAIDYEAAETGLSVALAAGDYWVGVICQATGGGYYHETTGGTSQEISGGATYTPPPDPFGGPGTGGSRKVSCWGVVGAAAGATFVPQVVIL